MSSKDSLRPKNVRFVEVANAGTREPAWLAALGAAPAPSSLIDDVAPLLPPEVPSQTRPAFAPILDSVRPPAPASAAPPQRSYTPPPHMSATSRLPSQYPSPAEAAALLDSALLGGARDKRRDTLVEDLVPRAEEEAVAAITAAVEQFARDRALALENAEREIIQLVRVICRRVVLREVSVNPNVIEDLVMAGLEALGRGDRVTVRLGPFFADARDHLAEELATKGVDCAVVIDPSVGPHGCQLETQFGRVDESVETRLDVLMRGIDATP
jgi:flagellar assembly protein FliH